MQSNKTSVFGNVLGMGDLVNAIEGVQVKRKLMKPGLLCCIFPLGNAVIQARFHLDFGRIHKIGNYLFSAETPLGVSKGTNLLKSTFNGGINVSWKASQSQRKWPRQGALNHCASVLLFGKRLWHQRQLSLNSIPGCLCL